MFFMTDIALYDFVHYAVLLDLNFLIAIKNYLDFKCNAEWERRER